MKRYFRAILIVAALVLALCLTITRRGSHGIGLGAGTPSRAAQTDDSHPYDLAALRIFNSTLMRVNDAYVDPTRVDPKEMLLAALDQVQKSVAEVMVQAHPEHNQVTVRVDAQEKDFSIADVDSPWALSMKMKEIFRFIAQNLPADTDSETVRNIEYAATNGMLSTLDPHSMLLDPASYGEMKLSTRGSFGGLGIVIGIRKGALTVLRPMPGTPAWNAGLKPGDQIVRIEKDSTVNMLLNDAVQKLRGDPGTQVQLWIQRPSDKNPTPRKVVLTRAIIQVKTVVWHMLKNNVGYVRLENAFGGNTSDELRRALTALDQKGMKALVLDIRSNPGGLLDQAIKVVDEFVDSGTIVTTVGYANKQREEKRATPGGLADHIPMAVLVNHGSASASEIVAGALKNLDRAVIIGTRTFGKGSVQVLYDNDDGSALKLTIAQYLTPGDVSIQSVGITPDVKLEKVLVDKDKGVWLFRDYKGLSESGLDAHLTSKMIHTGDKPLETLQFLAEKPKKAQVAKTVLLDDQNGDDDDYDPEFDDDQNLATEDPNHFVEDFEIQFAHDLVAQAKGYHRHDVLASSRAFFARKKADQQAQVTAALHKLGVDWTPVDQGVAPTLVSSLTTDRPKNEITAGGTLHFTATVTNKGPTVAGQVHGQLECDDLLLDGREFMFGRIKPGESRTFTVAVKIPKDALSRVDPIKLQLFEDQLKKPIEGNPMLVRFQGLPRPIFQYAYQLVDDLKGNGDGLVQRGESVRLHVTVKNIGPGQSTQTLAQLRSLSDDGLYINKGRFDIDHLAPGQAKSVDFTFDVKPEYKQDDFKVELSVYDSVLHEFITDRLNFPIAAAHKEQSASGTVLVSAAKAEIRGGASATSPLVGTAAKGSRFKLTGSGNGFWRVALDGRPGFIVKKAAARSSGAATTRLASFDPAWQVSPPLLTIKPGPELVNASSYHLSGSVHDTTKVADVFAFVSNRTAKIDHRKVFYSSNRKGAQPNRMKFESEIPLWPGENVITVVARESTQVQAQQTLIVDRSGPRLVESDHHGTFSRFDLPPGYPQPAGAQPWKGTGNGLPPAEAVSH